MRWARGFRLIGWLGSPLGLLAVARLAGLRMNLTGSLPVGVYLVSGAAPSRDAIVLTCLPPRVAAFARERGYVPRRGGCPGRVLPVGKPIVAIAGDTVTVTPSGLFVNGRPVPNSQPLTVDRQGRPLPRLALGRYVVQSGALWVVSSYSRFSFDSRYFGPVETRQVRAGVQPLWTAGADR